MKFMNVQQKRKDLSKHRNRNTAPWRKSSYDF